MLQYITQPSAPPSIPAQVEAAISGGCRWVQLSMPATATDAQVEEMASQLTPLCRQSGTILVIDHRVEAVMHTKVHGVQLGPDDMPPAEARQYLGPHAIVGCSAVSAEQILALRGLDVDYVHLGPLPDAAAYAAVMEQLRAEGVQIPVVAVGPAVTAEQVPALLRAGVSGVAVGAPIALAANPTEETERFITILNSH